jgi:hypothetical protein
MPSADDFDFWLGTWDVRWGPNGQERGRNVITRSFGGRVIQEDFDGRPGIELVGMSMTVFDEHRELWRQTWVDDDGNYFALEGNVVGDEMVLLCDRHNGPLDTVYRMRWLDITRDTLTWVWERSSDGGASFDELWRLAYARA